MPEKIVTYEKYCKKCRHYKENESDPKSKCWDCLNEPINIDSRKPIHFEEAVRG